MLEFLTTGFNNCTTEIANAQVKFYNQLQINYGIWFGINLILALLLVVKNEKIKAYFSNDMVIWLLIINNFAQVFCAVLLVLFS